MRALTGLQSLLLDEVRRRAPDHVVVGSDIAAARALEKRGLVEIGTTKLRDEDGIRIYWVTLLPAGRELKEGGAVAAEEDP